MAADPLAMPNLLGDLARSVCVRERIAKLPETGAVECGNPLGESMPGLPIDLAGELCSLGQVALALLAQFEGMLKTVSLNPGLA